MYAIVFILLLLQSCLSPIKTGDIKTYSLSKLPISFPKKQTNNVTLVVGQPNINAVLNNKNLWYTQVPYKLAPYAKHRWLVRPNVMLWSSLTSALLKSNYFNQVIKQNSEIVHADFLISSTINNMQQVFLRSSKYSYVTLDITVYIINFKKQIIVSSKQFIKKMKTKSSDPYHAVKSYNSLLARLLKDIVLYTQQNIGKNYQYAKKNNNQFQQSLVKKTKVNKAKAKQLIVNDKINQIVPPQRKKLNAIARAKKIKLNSVQIPREIKLKKKLTKKMIAQDLKNIKEFYKQKQYKKVYNTLKPIASQGDAQAQYSVAYLHLYGLGIDKNKDKALFWIKKSAEQGFENAKTALKILNISKDNNYRELSRYKSKTKKDNITINTKEREGVIEKKKVRSKKQLSKQVPSKEFSLVEKYYNQKQYKKVYNIIQPMAEQGNSRAQYTLGYLYTFGLGVNKHKDLALFWIKQSAKQGYKNAQIALKGLNIDNEKDKAIKLKINKKKINEVKKRINNQYYEKESDKQIASFEKKIRLNKSNMINNKGLLNDKVVMTVQKKPQDSNNIANSLDSSEKNNNIESLSVNKNEIDIKRALIKAKAYYNLNDYKKVYVTLKPFAQKGEAAAQYTLGYLYLYGKGVEKSNAKAFFWFRKSARQGFEYAKDALTILDDEYYLYKIPLPIQQKKFKNINKEPLKNLKVKSILSMSSEKLINTLHFK